MNSYNLKILGLERELPICSINDKVDIAAFVMFDDVELTVKAAQALNKMSPEYDVVLTAECKGIPLCYEMARQSGKDYVVARKSIKLYMSEPISVVVKSITTEDTQFLHLSREKAELLKGKRVLIVDDVISTGESLKALEKLVEISEGIIVGKATVLAEGDAKNREDIIFIESLPLFFK